MKDYSKVELYSEVLKLANNKGYTLKIVDTNDVVNPASMAGFNATSTKDKFIEIGVDSSSSEFDAILVHELLHSKLYLNGFPKFYVYGLCGLSSSVNSALMEIENISHHTLIYQEMKRLGYNTKEIDRHYLDTLLDDNDKTFIGGNKVNRALKLMEGYLRMPDLIIKYESDIRSKQNEEYNLFQQFKSLYKNTFTPYLMRKSIVKVLSHVNNYARIKEKTNLYLNYLSRLVPIYNTVELNKKASKMVHFIKFNEYSDNFLIGTQDEQCIAFVSEQYDIETLIEKMSLRELLLTLNLEYGEK